MKKPYELTSINGIKTVLYPLPDFPSIKIQLLVKAGSWHEEGEDWGALHLLEHLVHKGTKAFSNRDKIELFKETHGLTSNAFTGGGMTGFWVKGPHYSLTQAVTLINELVFNPLLPESEFQKEISIIEQEYHDKWDNPYTRFGRALDQQIFGSSHPYVRDGMGQPGFLRKLTHNQLFELHRKFFTKNNLILSVTGNFEINSVKTLLTSLLNPLENKTHNKRVVGETSPASKQLVHRESMKQHQIVLRYPLPGREQLALKDRIKLGVARYLIGSSTNSILFKTLREKHNLVYRTGSDFRLLPSTGYFEVWASTNPDSSTKALKLMRSIVKNFVQKPIPKASFERAIGFLNANTIINFDSVDEISSSTSHNLFWEDQIYLPEDYVDISKTITPSMVQDIFANLIKPENEYLGIMADESHKIDKILLQS